MGFAAAAQEADQAAEPLEAGSTQSARLRKRLRLSQGKSSYLWFSELSVHVRLSGSAPAPQQRSAEENVTLHGSAYIPGLTTAQLGQCVWESVCV